MSGYQNDEVIAVIDVNDNRRIVVHVGKHRGRDYVRFRYWNCHLKRRCWYANSHRWGPRAFHMPLEAAPALGQALIDAAEFGKDSGISP